MSQKSVGQLRQELGREIRVALVEGQFRVPDLGQIPYDELAVVAESISHCLSGLMLPAARATRSAIRWLDKHAGKLSSKDDDDTRDLLALVEGVGAREAARQLRTAAKRHFGWR